MAREPRCFFASETNKGRQDGLGGQDVQLEKEKKRKNTLLSLLIEEVHNPTVQAVLQKKELQKKNKLSPIAWGDDPCLAPQSKTQLTWLCFLF